MFSNFQDDILEWIPKECICWSFHLSDRRSRQLKPYGEITLLPITFEPTVIDECNGYLSVCLVAPNRMIPKYDQHWPDLTCDPKLGGRSNFYLFFFFLATLGITRFVSTRETRWCQICCCRTNNAEVIVEKRKNWKLMLDPNTFWPLAPKRLTWGQTWELFQIAHYIALPLLFAVWNYLS